MFSGVWARLTGVEGTAALRNRRRHQRMALDLPIEVRLEEASFFAVVSSVSPSGMRLIIEQPTLVGSPIQVRIESSSAWLPARITWVERLGGKWRAGVAIESGLESFCSRLSGGRAWRDRRRQRRFLGGLVCCLERNGRRTEAVCLDLSRFGCRLLMAQARTDFRGSALLRLGPSSGWAGLRLRVRRVYVQRSPDGQVILGLAFQQVTSRLNSLLRHLAKTSRDCPSLPATWNWVTPPPQAEPPTRTPSRRPARRKKSNLPQRPRIIKARRLDRCPSLWAARVLPVLNPNETVPAPENPPNR